MAYVWGLVYAVMLVAVIWACREANRLRQSDVGCPECGEVALNGLPCSYCARHPQ